MVAKIAGEGKHSEGRPGEFVAGVPLGRLYEPQRVPGESRGEVHLLAEENGSSCRRQEVAEDELERVSVLRRPANRHFVLMVDLVHVRIDRLVVQHAMAEMKSEIL